MRLTERKVSYPQSDKKGNLTKVDYIEIKNKGLAEEKLCQLEDIEEELGIDLITIFKALKNGIYLKLDNKYIKKPLFVELFRITRLHSREIFLTFSDAQLKPRHFKDYGKTWALTKEELL